MAETFALPPDLPIPAPSKAAIHLPGHPLPPLIELPSTSGGVVDLFLLSLTRPVLLFIYPRTGAPGEQIQETWNQIPGARGCTPELCSVRDGIQSLLAREPTLAIFGLSTQGTDYQTEVVQRLGLPFPLLSDSEFALQSGLDLPTFEWQSTRYLQRITLLLREGQITQVQYPVFPPDSAAKNALDMLAPPTTSRDGGNDDEMTMNAAYPALRDEVGEQDQSERFQQIAPSKASQASPATKTGSFTRSRLSKRSPSDWRNSLVVVDDETGTVIGVVAEGVVLSNSEETREDGQDDDDDDDDDEPQEARTPTADGPLVYNAAHTYDDPDVRPASRVGSVLGEETFAPPPVPDKPGHLRVGKANADDGDTIRSSIASAPFFSAREDESGLEEDDIVDGKVKVYVQHAEAHRPDLLRDRRDDDDDDDDGEQSDASGSTVGGPAVQLWRKARGGKQGEAKRRAKKEARRLRQEEEERQRQQALRVPKIREPSEQSVRTSRAETALEGDDEMEDERLSSTPPPSPQGVSALLSTQADSSETGAHNGIELRPRGWQSGTKKSAMSRHLQGNSVLIEFLAGSRIGASVIQSATPFVPDERPAATLEGPDVFTPTRIAAIPHTGAMAYIPVLPSHLLWFFGLDVPNDASETNSLAKDVSPGDAAGVLGPVAVMGEDLMLMARGMAAQGAHLAWSSLAGWGSSARSWLDSGLSLLSYWGPEAEPNVLQVEQGDADADEWEWAVPAFDSTTLENTPRPIYRRKKLVPSLEGNFSARSPCDGDSDRSDRYSIVHFDHMGIARRAFTRFQGS